jgi:hypothetical protein
MRFAANGRRPIACYRHDTNSTDTDAFPGGGSVCAEWRNICADAKRTIYSH